MKQARTIREKAGKSLLDVARGTSIEISHLGKFERGVVELSIPKLQELAAYYSSETGRKVTIDDLVKGAQA